MGVLCYFIFILLYFMQTKQTLFRVHNPQKWINLVCICPIFIGNTDIVHSDIGYIRVHVIRFDTEYKILAVTRLQQQASSQ